MKVNLKPISEQVIVITGPSSGIGLVTARMAAKKGARLVLASRSDEALRELADELNGDGKRAVAVPADVADEGDVRRVADEAVANFGGFDTWVNNAGVSIYGRILDVPMEDNRRLFDTNFWGVVYGSIAAARHLRSRGGAIVNVGSTLSDRAIPIQGMYSASKHAVKAFTDALRMELEEEGAPVSVTLIKPGSIDTPYPQHAKNYLEKEPTVPPPVYAPEVVAEAILHAAAHPVRDLFAGAGGKAFSVAEKVAPRLTDKMMERAAFGLQKSAEPASEEGHDGLYRASGELEERGGLPFVQERSLYTKASMHPVLTAGLAVGAGVAIAGLLRQATR